MLFNSSDFFVFLILVFSIYWIIPSKWNKLRNILILVSSYIFYGWWEWRFLLLIIFSSLVDYFIGVFLSKTEESSKRKLLLAVSLIINLGLLGVFKYYDFFITEFNDFLMQFGLRSTMSTLRLILPVGISFYTFQSLSYSIDCYRRKLEPCKDIIQFFSYVAFFPQLVAGPIERAKNLLPQFATEKKFDRELAVSGVYQIIWGFFKKVVIADNCAILANEIFNQESYSEISSGVLMIGAVLFAFQIYGDFSGYSDIAIGTAKLFGIRLMKNFDFPYFSRDIAEFWRRWHISLSTWFKDYIYFPLGGSRGGKLKTMRNVFVIFLVSGFWHGANWTYVMWGFINALLFVPLYIFDLNRSNLGVAGEGSYFPKFIELFTIPLNFVLVCFAWIFFRSDNISRAYEYIYSIFTNLHINASFFSRSDYTALGIITAMVFYLLIVEWMNRKKEFGMEFYTRPILITSSYLTLLLIFFYGQFDYQEFIYFQF